MANQFAVDTDALDKKIVWPGYFVPRAQASDPGRMLIRGCLHAIKSANDIVFALLVTELGKRAALALQKRGGTLCRSFGQTAKSEGIEEDLTAKKAKIGENMLATVSIRYTLTPGG